MNVLMMTLAVLLAAADPLEEFERRLKEAKDRDALRTDLLKFLGSDAGRKSAVRVLGMLLKLPPRSQPPAAPAFPFDADRAARYQKEYAEAAGLPLSFRDPLGMTFVLVPPGSFLIGSPESEPGRSPGERQVRVTLTRPFYLGKHEVTVRQFRAFVEATKHVTDVEKKGGGHAHDAKAVWEHRPGTNWKKPGYPGPYTQRDDHPVVHVSHADCKAFCRWLSEGDVTFDLPTEAQWEWACRAGSGTRFWWGADEDTTGKMINAGDRALKRVHSDWPRVIMPMDDGHAFCAPVGSYRPNAWGLHDMLGNVWEFCSSRAGPYPKEAVTDPRELGTRESYAVRGGGWSNTPADCRCASRNSDPPHFGHSNLGFRVALPLPRR